MLTTYLRQALQSPLPPLAAACRHFWSHGARIRRARMLCQCADSLRLRREIGWEERSSRLYRRSVSTLGDLAGPEAGPADDAGLVAHSALRWATGPYRDLMTTGIRLASLLTAVVLLVLTVLTAGSSSFRSRLFPRDLAAGQPWTVSNPDFNLPGSGSGPAATGSLLFHTANVRNPWVEIDLGEEHVIRGIRIENRDDCCQERALPLNVEIKEGETWRLVVQRRTAFSTWSEDIGPVRARRIRFLRPGTDYFHLKRIQVFGQ